MSGSVRGIRIARANGQRIGCSEFSDGAAAGECSGHENSRTLACKRTAPGNVRMKAGTGLAHKLRSISMRFPLSGVSGSGALSRDIAGQDPEKLAN